MRMVGRALSGGTDTDTFDEILRQAIALLKGEGLEPDEPTRSESSCSRVSGGFSSMNTRMWPSSSTNSSLRWQEGH